MAAQVDTKLTHDLASRILWKDAFILAAIHQN